MKIHSMTATFGKLEHQSLTLKPGLNVIHAPNEWGKTTWCTFLVTMLYGLETRVKSTKTALADKEKYAPWSGSPMAGRIDLNWNGRDITIERWSKGRTPLGEFRAYETATGLDVPELTGANCGQMLLGVEKSVFTRAGFLKLTDLPVTQDEPLRRRLNALVTTGDESGAADILAQKLKDLKNRCRHNRTGLLPQAESELAALEARRGDLLKVKQLNEKLRLRRLEVEQRRAALDNHAAALAYAQAQADANRVAQAAQTREETAQRLRQAEEECRTLPTAAEAERAAASIRTLRQQSMSIQMEEQMLPAPPEKPDAPAPFMGMNPEQAAQKAAEDRAQAGALRQQMKTPSVLLWILAAILLAAAAAATLAKIPYGWAIFIPAGAVLLWALVDTLRRNHRRELAQMALARIEQVYGTPNEEQWTRMAAEYAQSVKNYETALADHAALRGDLEQRKKALQQAIDTQCQGKSIADSLVWWAKISTAWETLTDARRDHQRAENHLSAVEAMAKIPRKPAAPDTLTYTEAETARLLSDTAAELRELQHKIGQCQGRMESLGDENTLSIQIHALKNRIGKLEDTYLALEYAQKALADAAADLQRRFAPKIAARAQELFHQLTEGRYDRMLLGEDLSVNAGAAGEDTLHSTLWRSDGTVDQLYLALRLAVAEELTPEAPLILDDALVRFDDKRLAVAMEILQHAAEGKQVILFTCQTRETQFA